MIDRDVSDRLKHMIMKDEETVLWAARPAYSLFSEYNIKFITPIILLILLWNVVVFSLNDAQYMKLVDKFGIITFAIPTIIVFLVIIWASVKPKFDSFMITDEALYVQRRGFFGWREGRLPHDNITHSKPFFGMKTCVSVAYSPLSNFKVAWNRIWDVSLSFGFYVRHSIHVRDIPNIDQFLALLKSKGHLSHE